MSASHSHAAAAGDDGSCDCGHDHHHHGPEDAAAEAAAERSTRNLLLFLELTVLLLWAVVMAWFYASGRIERYLVAEGGFRVQVLIAGMGLFVMGVFNWFMRARDAGCGHEHDHHDHDHDHADCADPDCGHDHAAAGPHHHEGTAGGRAAAILLLALPVTLAAASTADDFSDEYKMNMLHAESSRSAPAGQAPDEFRLAPASATVAAADGTAPGNTGGTGGGITLELIEKYQPRNEAGNFDLGVMQLYYSGSDPEYAAVMKGQGVETTGQMVKDTINPAPNRFRVFVLQVSCCAADARPYSLPVEFDGPVPDIQEMGWYRVVGKIDYTTERGITTAVLKADSVQATVRPRDQRMLF